MSTGVLLKKIKKKLLTQGVSGLVASVARRILKSLNRYHFKLISKIFLLKLRLFNKNNYLLMDFGEIGGVDLPAQEILTNIKANKYVILSEDLIDFGQGKEAGELVWNKDLINNIEWKKDAWGVDITIDTNRGEIKRPWEIGRLHQLVQLAFCFNQLENESQKQETYKLAGKILRNFSIENPGFLGPQWMCAMDVGIRIANICLAADLFGKKFKDEHRDLIDYEIKRHEFFIRHNLENKVGHVVNNHYLGNVIGMIFCSTHQIAATDVVEKTKRLYTELLEELEKQFSSDGSNFENSTYYHRLSGELVLFGIAIGQEYLLKHASLETNDKLSRKFKTIQAFSESITDYEGYVPQIGDNDSGHLFILDPLEFKNGELNHFRFISAVRSFVVNQGRKSVFLETLKGFATPTATVVSEFDESETAFGSHEFYLKSLSELSSFHNVQSYEFSIPEEILSSRKLKSFKDFGLFLYKSRNFFFCIRSGYSAKDFIGGHRHIDQLSMSLKTPGFSLARDPGSFTYTSDTKNRNLLRSAIVHHIPYKEGDGVTKDEDIFELRGFTGECLYFGHDGFYGSYQGQLDIYYRLIQFKNDKIIVYDWSEKQAPLVRLNFQEKVFSPQFGSLKKFE